MNKISSLALKRPLLFVMLLTIAWLGVFILSMVFAAPAALLLALIGLWLAARFFKPDISASKTSQSWRSAS